jgi:hypothetical protein
MRIPRQISHASEWTTFQGQANLRRKVARRAPDIHLTFRTRCSENLLPVLRLRLSPVGGVAYSKEEGTERTTSAIDETAHSRTLPCILASLYFQKIILHPSTR